MPRGLIKFASVNSIEKNTKFKFTSRAIGCSVLLTVLVGVLSYLLVTRTDFSITILRTPGLLFQEQPDDKVSNIYDLSIVNKTFEKAEIKLKLENINGSIQIIGKELTIEPQEIVDAKFLIVLPTSEISKMNTPVEIGVYNGNNLIKKVHTSLLGPVKKRKKVETES